MSKQFYKGLDGKQKYIHDYKTIKEDEGIKIIVKKNNKAISTPDMAEPGDNNYTVLTDKNKLKRTRFYNSLTNSPILDIDYDVSHHEIKGTHVHEWVDGKRNEDARYPTEEEKKQIMLIQKVFSKIDKRE